MKQVFKVNSDAVEIKVSVHPRQGGRSSEVVVKRGSTTYWKTPS